MTVQLIAWAAVAAALAACGGMNRQEDGEASFGVVPHAPMNAARAAHTATVFSDGRVLVTGGCTRTGCQGIAASAELYQPASRSFSELAPMGVARASHASTMLSDGRVLVTGGWTDRGGVDRRDRCR